MPILTREDVGDPVTIPSRFELGTQECHLHPLHTGLLRGGVGVGMAHVQLSDELGDHIVQIGTVGYMGHQRLVAVIHCRPIHAVHSRIVEPIPHQNPSIVVDLGPFHLGIDVEVHLFQIQPPGIVLLSRLDVHDPEVRTPGPIDDLLPVSGDGKPVDSGNDLL